MSLTEPSIAYKPFLYPWAFKFWQTAQSMHWLPTEVTMSDDVSDFRALPPKMRAILGHVFRMFVQADIDVSQCYHKIYQSIFKPTEVAMMLTAFANMECFDRETELLTSTGWKRCPDITMSDLVAQYDLADSTISFVKPDKVVAYPYIGKMHHYKNRSTDICVTPNHDLILTHPTTGVRQKRKSMEGKWGRNYLYPSAGIAVGSRAGPTALEKVLIAVAADGSMRGFCPSAPRSRTTDISFSKCDKIVMMEALLGSAGITFTKRSMADGRTNFCFPMPSEVDLASVKSLNFIDLVDLSSRGAELYVEEILWWDGSTRGSALSFYSTERRAIDKYQALCTLANVSSIVGVNRTAEQTLKITLPNDKHPQTSKDCYVVSASDRVDRTYPHRAEIDYDGEVYCVSVPTQNLVSRRNGRVACTGNTIHIAAYSHLIDTLGLPESEYAAFLEYTEMKSKHDWMHSFNPSNPQEVAESLAGVSGFGEGLALFASFAILLNFPRQNLLKGMGQIVTWSIRDESLHCEGIMKLFHAYCAEKRDEIDTPALNARIRVICEEAVAHEDHFIDLVYSEGDMPGLTAAEVKVYIRSVANMRLIQLGCAPIYEVPANPLPWVNQQQVQLEHTNFFEQQATEYSRAATSGSWGDAF